jgi:hypothetical protein
MISQATKILWQLPRTDTQTDNQEAENDVFTQSTLGANAGFKEQMSKIKYWCIHDLPSATP